MCNQTAMLTLIQIACFGPWFLPRGNGNIQFGPFGQLLDRRSRLGAFVGGFVDCLSSDEYPRALSEAIFGNASDVSKALLAKSLGRSGPTLGSGPANLTDKELELLATIANKMLGIYEDGILYCLVNSISSDGHIDFAFHATEDGKAFSAEIMPLLRSMENSFPSKEWWPIVLLALILSKEKPVDIPPNIFEKLARSRWPSLRALSATH